MSDGQIFVGNVPCPKCGFTGCEGGRDCTANFVIDCEGSKEIPGEYKSPTYKLGECCEHGGLARKCDICDLTHQLAYMTARAEEAEKTAGIWKTTSDCHAKLLIEYEDRAKRAEAERDAWKAEAMAARKRLSADGTSIIVFSGLDELDKSVASDYATARTATDNLLAKGSK